MPSLSNLEKFRDSFHAIGKESEYLASKGLPIEDFPLPDTSDVLNGTETNGKSAKIAQADETASEQQNESEIDINKLFADSGVEAISDLDLDKLFGDLSEEAQPSNQAEETPEASEPTDPSSVPQDPDKTEDTQPPSERPDAESQTEPELETPDAQESVDFASVISDATDPEETSLNEEATVLGPDDLPPFDPNEAQDNFSLDNLPPFKEVGTTKPDQSPSDEFSLADLPPFDPNEAQDSFSLDELPSLGPLPSEADETNNETPPSTAGTESSELDNLDLDDDFGMEGVPGFDLPLDKLTNLDALPPELTNDIPPPLEAVTDDFIVPGLDDIFGDKTKKETQEFTASDNVEEINLSEEEYEDLKNTLDGFPLNLRIACEELIAEEAVAPDQMSRLIKMLIKGAGVQEVAELAGKIQGRIINIPKGFEKKSGAEIEAEKSSLKYIFIHKLLPLFGWTLFITSVIASLLYLGYRFIWTPIYADSIYKDGYQSIEQGQYEDANRKFNQAFTIHPVRKWFYRYAAAFIEKRQYIHAEKKYEELLKYYPKEKQGALDYAALETYTLQNYEKADNILRRYILDYIVNDKEALLAVGDNALLWGDLDYSRYESAREAYALYIQAHGENPSVLERMLKYFIRTNNLKETLNLKNYFMDPGMKKKRNIAPETLTELSGYLFDRQFEEVEGVPDEYVSAITGTRELLLEAVELGPLIPEAHYNLSRYYNYFKNTREEGTVLARALPLFESAPETVKRLKTHIDAERRYARVLIKNKEFFVAEEHLSRGLRLYEDGLARGLFQPEPELARLYADMGDLDYFTKEEDWEMALRYYEKAEQSGWKPPEMLYRMGSAFYHQKKWAQAKEKFTEAASELPLNRRILNTLGNVSYQRGDYFAAQGYYKRLLDLLNADKDRFPQLLPQSRADHYAIAERLMVAQNNMGVVLEALAERTGNPEHSANALNYYIDSQRAWDSITRNRGTFIRAGINDLAMPGVNLAYLNSQNAFNKIQEFTPQIYVEIDKDVLEPSEWEEIIPDATKLSEPLD